MTTNSINENKRWILYTLSHYFQVKPNVPESYYTDIKELEKFILKKKADLNRFTIDGCSLLQYILYKLDISHSGMNLLDYEILELLLKHGLIPNPPIKPSNNFFLPESTLSPLAICIVQSPINIKLVELLLKYNAEPNYYGNPMYRNLMHHMLGVMHGCLYGIENESDEYYRNIANLFHLLYSHGLKINVFSPTTDNGIIPKFLFTYNGFTIQNRMWTYKKFDINTSEYLPNMRERFCNIVVALQNLDLPTYLLRQILIKSDEFAYMIPRTWIWNLIVIIKHRKFKGIEESYYTKKIVFHFGPSPRIHSIHL